MDKQRTLALRRAIPRLSANRAHRRIRASRRQLIVLSLVACLFAATPCNSAPLFGQAASLEGRWEGTVELPQGQSPAVATFKKNGDTFTGTITGRNDVEMPFKSVTIQGEKVLAETALDSPQGGLTIKYEFTLQGDTLKGSGKVDFSGQTFTFQYSLKRVQPGQPAAPQQRASQPQGSQTSGQQPQRTVVPQPTQKQSLEYFLGQWNFKWTGRESAMTPGGTAEGTVTFSPAGDGKFIESRTEGKSADGLFRESALIGFDEEKKVLAVLERRHGGAELLALGDWSTAIAIRFSIAPVKVKGETIRLKRTINVVSTHSFTVTEELAEGDGPFQRLGNAIFTKAAAATAPSK